MTPGAKTKPGYFYHEPAFAPDNVLVQRGDNRHRLEILLRSENWWNKNVLDIGCNVGYFSIKLALQGARVTGIDADPDSIAFAGAQAMEHNVEGVVFGEPGQECRYAKDKDVLLALSVLPWIYQTEQDPEEVINRLFKIPVAYVEIPYPPDGRAHVPGVIDDKTAEEYLRRFYPTVFKIGKTEDVTDGVSRNRTIWKCMVAEVPKTFIYGSQAIVDIEEHSVTKRPRKGKNYNPAREAKFLDLVSEFYISPRVISCSNSELKMTRIHGWPLTVHYTNSANVIMQLDIIKKALDAAGICHNDIRPANLILGADYNIYLIDFGWATMANEQKPEGVNPVFGPDQEAINKIELEYCNG